MISYENMLLRINAPEHVPAAVTARERLRATWEIIPETNVPWKRWQDVVKFLTRRVYQGTSLPRIRMEARRLRRNRLASTLLALTWDDHVLMVNTQHVPEMEEWAQENSHGTRDERLVEVAEKIESALEADRSARGTGGEENETAPFVIDFDPYLANWRIPAKTIHSPQGEKPILATHETRPKNRDAPISHETYRRLAGHASESELEVYTDGSTPVVHRGDSGAAAVWYLRRGEMRVKIGTARARIRHFQGNYLPEVLGIALALRFTPLHIPVSIFYDCNSAVQSVRKRSRLISCRRRNTSSARQVVETARGLLRERMATTQWNKVKAHAGESEGNDEADREANEARSGCRVARARIWRQGAERVILMVTYPPAKGGRKMWPGQVMAGTRGHLQRQELRKSRDIISKTGRMGRGFRLAPTQLLPLLKEAQKSLFSNHSAAILLSLTGHTPTRRRRAQKEGVRQQTGGHLPLEHQCQKGNTGAQANQTHTLLCPAGAADLLGEWHNIWQEWIQPIVRDSRRKPPITATDRCKLHMVEEYESPENLDSEVSRAENGNRTRRRTHVTIIKLMNAWIGGKGTAPAEERDTTGSNPVLLRNHSRMKGCEGWGEAVKAEREWRRIMEGRGRPGTEVRLRGGNEAGVRGSGTVQMRSPPQSVWNDLQNMKTRPIYTLVADMSPWLCPGGGDVVVQNSRQRRYTTAIVESGHQGTMERESGSCMAVGQPRRRE
jgi:ribonuclease HI